MAFRKVRSDGRIVLPKSMVQAAGIEAGDSFLVRKISPRHIEIRAIPNLTIDELVARYPIEGPIDEAADREAWQDEAAKDVIGQ